MKNKGFSLIETLIYIAVLVIITSFLSASIVVTMRSFRYIQLSRLVNSGVDMAMERVMREIRLAYDIDTANSTLNFSPGKLVLKTYTMAGATTTAEIYIENGELKIKEGAGAGVELTPTGITITNLIFRQINTGTISKAIKVEFGIRGIKGNLQRDENFYSTAILRGNY